MFSKLPSTKKRIKMATDVQKGAAACGRDYDPVIAGSFLIPTIIACGVYLYFVSSNIDDVEMNADRYNCQQNPNTLSCRQINSKMTECNSLFIQASTVLTICVLSFALLLKKSYSLFEKNKPNPHHKTAYEFYKNNPQYPGDREETSVHCPILNDDTKQPVFLEITFMDGKKATPAYDYASLQTWFLTHARDPHTNTNLLDLNKIREIKFSFDNPEAEANNTYRRKNR